jgi:hypothetical protein
VTAPVWDETPVSCQRENRANAGLWGHEFQFDSASAPTPAFGSSSSEKCRRTYTRQTSADLADPSTEKLVETCDATDSTLHRDGFHSRTRAIAFDTRYTGYWI